MVCPGFHPFVLRHPKANVILGTHGLFGLLPVHLDLTTFNSHLYVVGTSGQGKSKFLQHVLAQLATTQWGCGVFDPHADLAS